MRRLIAWHLVALAAASAVFLVAPDLDLWVSGLFYRPGDGFYLANSVPVQVLFHLVPWLVTLQLVLIPVVVGAGWWRGRPVAGFDWRAGLFVLTVLAIGPGIVVNGILKDHWGRARPVQISEFGGARHFTPAPLAADECDRNCSFVAGHPAVGFALIAYAYLARERRRRRLIAAGAIGLGAAEGFARLAQGGHFLSDVVFSGLLVSLITLLLAAALLEHDGFGALGRRCAELFKMLGPRWIVFAGLTLTVTLFSIRYIDQPLVLYLRGVDPKVHAVFAVITKFGLAGGYLVIALTAAAGLWVAGWRRHDPARAAWFRSLAAVPMFLFLTVAISGLVTDVLKIVFGRARPHLLIENHFYGFTWFSLGPRYWSFPSGHTTTAFAIATALYLLWPRFLPFYAIFAALVTISRAVVEEHYLSDAIVGAFVGIAATCYLYDAFIRRGINLGETARGRTLIERAPLNSP